MPLDKTYFEPPFPFEAPLGRGTSSFDVFAQGDGPPVIIIQELPGIGQETISLADELIKSGYRVYLPHLFGPIGRTSFAGNMVRVMCMHREFSLFASNRSSPIVDWLRALARHVREQTNAPGVGVIGMCLTGNFAISLIADDNVLAAVAAQPSMPLGKHTALHMSAPEVDAIAAGLDTKGPMIAYRFEEDTICRAAKFDALEEKFNADGRERIRLKTIPGPGHSVFTLHFVNEAGHPTRDALDEVVDYFNAQLKSVP